jgi:hypothetical protein
MKKRGRSLPLGDCVGGKETVRTVLVTVTSVRGPELGPPALPKHRFPTYTTYNTPMVSFASHFDPFFFHHHLRQQSDSDAPTRSVSSRSATTAVAKPPGAQIRYVSLFFW